MSLQPALSATLGNLRYDTHAWSCHACLALLPRGHSADIELPTGVRFDAVPGDTARLDVDGGEGSHTLLTGTVRSVRRASNGLVASVGDAGSALSAFRPCVTFEKQSAAQIIKKLAQEAAVQQGTVDLDLDLPAYVAHPTRTASEHIAHLAMLAGAVAFTDADGRLVVKPRPSGQPTSALRYGREIVRYEVHAGSPADAERYAIGFGPAGSADAPDALRASLEPLPASAPDAGLGVRRRPRPELRTPAAATTASTAAQSAVAARSERLVADCFLLPALRPGDVFEVQDLPDGLRGGPWFITRLEHRFEGGAAFTTVTAEKADAASLLGALLAGIGGLL